jgi:DNA-binding HxlR family transcriptional regulator
MDVAGRSIFIGYGGRHCERANVIQSRFDFLVLNVLTAGPVCSSDIEQRIGQRMRLFFEVDSASVLKTLQRLESAGWLVSEWREKEDSKSRRSIPSLAPARKNLRPNGKRGIWPLRSLRTKANGRRFFPRKRIAGTKGDQPPFRPEAPLPIAIEELRS